MTSFSKIIKLVIADDSAFLRKVLQEELEASKKIQVVGAARNGKEAIEIVKKTQPDILILDCEMPVMNGLECLRKIQQECPLPVFMFSSLTYEGASVTIKALEYGAVDFFHKPVSGAHGLSEVIDELIRKIETIIRQKRFIGSARHSIPEIARKSQTLLQKRSIDLIVLGSSTGGVQASREVIPKLPKDMKPIVWVQHMPPNFTASLANRLNDLSAMTVKEAKDGDVIEQGTCYLAPGGVQMKVQKSLNRFKLKIQGDEKVSGHCPSCNVLFDSVAEYFSSNALGVILTGMGDDGAQGLKKMHAQGSFVIGQNEESCVVYGMPKKAYEAGAVDVEMDIKDIAEGMKNIIK